MEDKKLYIWQLQEKIDDIDKETNYCIIHDNEVKKVLVSRIYDFFNQDDKILDIESNIEILLNEYDSEWQSKYIDLEVSIVSYQQLVKELQEKFKVNQNDIRRLTTEISNMENDNIDTDETLKDINSKYEILLSTIESFRSNVSKLQEESNSHTSDIKTLEGVESELHVEIYNVHENFNSMNKTIEDMEKYSVLIEKTDEFLKRVDDKYDKIISIIDYYHHIHDKDNK